MADNNAMRVLVVEDEPSLRDVIGRALDFAGYEVDSVGSFVDARQSLASNLPDIAVLDVMLPDGSGFDLGARLRADHPDISIVFLTARDSVDDRLTGFALGGDDYIVKPFSVAELVARIGAVSRRARPVAAADPVLKVADLELHEHAHEVRRGNSVIELSPTEFRLLHALLRNAGRVMSKSQLLDDVWQYDFNGDAGVVEKFISQLRRKIDGDRPPLLHTVRGFGYVIREQRP